MKNIFYLYILFPLMMIFMELGSHFSLFGFSSGSYILSQIIIAVGVGSLIALIGSFFKKKAQKAVPMEASTPVNTAAIRRGFASTAVIWKAALTTSR